MQVDIQASWRFVWHQSIAEIPVHAWQDLCGHHPFLQHAMLHAFEASGAVGGQSGWVPHHLAVYQGQQLLAAMPLYLKTHSYGEYVFDWAWAEAFERAGYAYYPKIIAAIPFSPVTGARLLLHPDCVDAESLAAAMLAALAATCEQQGLSSAHVLFPDVQSSAWCAQAGWLKREGVQFRWENCAYADWAAFLSQLSHDKRKKIKQERKKVSQQGVTCRVLNGHQASAEDWALFYQCYCHTYQMHGSQPYLPADFFQRLAQSMPNQVALFIASLEGQDIASSLCIHNQETLYGRYWGALVDVSCLHFELCYYQPQQYCIAQGIHYFEGGAQGVHKLARGFATYPTCSYHWLQHAGLRQAVAQFLSREQAMMTDYLNELDERSPFRQSL